MEQNKKAKDMEQEQPICEEETTVTSEEETKAPEETTINEEDPSNKTDAEAELKDRLIRTMAEFDNYKKRTQKEKEALYEYTVCDVVSKILPVYDTLGLSLNHPTQDEALKTGVELTLKQFKEVLEKLGVTEIEALGKPFDPNFHNAVMHIDDNSYGEKEVVEVLQAGYRLRDKVIRYSMVKVAN